MRSRIQRTALMLRAVEKIVMLSNNPPAAPLNLRERETRQFTVLHNPGGFILRSTYQIREI